MIFKRTLMTCALLMPHLLSASPQNTSNDTKALATFYAVEGTIEKEYNNLVEKKLSAIGFQLTSPYTRVNSILDILSFSPVVRDSIILPLLNIDPRIAGFAPFNVLLYKKSDENLSHVGHLTPEVMLDILKIDNDEIRRKFSSPFKALDATIAQELGGDVSTLSYQKLPEKTMINYALEFDTNKDINTFMVEFQKKFKLAFTDAGYLVSDYHNFMDATPDAKTILSNYQAFGTYSLNHLELTNTILETQSARPEAGIFAPFTIYMYIKKETHTVVLGMVRLHNWSDTLGITDEKDIKIIEHLDSQIPQLLEKMGMHTIENTNPLLAKANNTAPMSEKSVLSPHSDTPKEEQKNNITTDAQTSDKVQANMTTTNTPSTTDKHIQHIKILNKVVDIKIPTVPEVISVAFGNESISTHRGITFSKRVPPNYVPHRFDKALKSQELTSAKIGEVAKGKIAAYLRGEFIEVENLKKSLESAGFKVLATAPVNKKEDLVSIVFTNDDLLTLSAKPNRGFMASLRVLVDTKEKTMSITNPLYIAKGFLQDDFDETIAKKVLAKLVETFPKLTNSKDSLKYQLLPKYQFMNGMPKYQDMIEVASGSDLLEKIKDNKKVVFTQTLSNGATLIGIQLGKRTRKFTKRIGRNNAAMLPYPILIEDGKAKILDPKFYISYMYPMLTMSEFMTIATVPDAMVKDCEKVFQ